jgi:predicted 3-demethylubiquinone-9 3-methyltransferase (glyoxalase superfamily)
MARSITPFLMFSGHAEEAMNAYVALFEGSEVRNIERYAAGEQGAEGSVKRADFTVAGQPVICIDSPVPGDFTFTPSFSLFVECADADELDRAFAALSEGGGVMMPPDDYGFSKRFTWLNDRFGVSWQLNLV